MEQAIMKSIEGGWKPFGSIIVRGGNIESPQKWGVPEVMANFYHQPTFLLDPLFWQSLYKSTSCFHKNGGPYRHRAICQVGQYEWEYKWHQFIDHLAKGEDIESFFISLLKK